MCGLYTCVVCVTDLVHDDGPLYGQLEVSECTCSMCGLYTCVVCVTDLIHDDGSLYGQLEVGECTT